MGKKKQSVDERFGAYHYEPPSSSKKSKERSLKWNKNADAFDETVKYHAVPTTETRSNKPVDYEGDSGGYPRTVLVDKGAFCTNYVSTTKYSRWSFLPLATLQQYKRGANLYLLFIAVLCCIPAISPLMPIAAVMPVVFVLTISLIREGVEDYHRYVHDEELNSKVLF